MGRKKIPLGGGAIGPRFFEQSDIGVRVGDNREVVKDNREVLTNEDLQNQEHYVFILGEGKYEPVEIPEGNIRHKFVFEVSDALSAVLQGNYEMMLIERPLDSAELTEDGSLVETKSSKHEKAENYAKKRKERGEMEYTYIDFGQSLERTCLRYLQGRL